MAVNIIQGVEVTEGAVTSKMIAAHNSNVLLWESDDLTGVTKGTVIVTFGADDYTFEVSPSPDEVFRFDLREVIKSILGEANGATAYNSVFYNYADLSKLIDIELKVTDGVAPEQTTTITGVRITQAVMQIGSKNGANLIDYIGDASRLGYILDTYKGAYSRSFKYGEDLQKIVHFKHFPFSISFYVPAGVTNIGFVAADDTAVGGVTGPDLDTIITVPIGTGADDIDYDQPKGLFEIADNVDDIQANYIDLYHYNYEYRDDCEGVYIKWLNPLGAWSYWLFTHIYTGTIDVGSRREKAVYADTMTGQASRTATISQRAVEQITIAADGLEAERLRWINEMLSSPKIYLYTADKGTETTAADWVEVKALQGSSQTYNSKRGSHQFIATLELPEKYLQ